MMTSSNNIPNDVSHNFSSKPSPTHFPNKFSFHSGALPSCNGPKKGSSRVICGSNRSIGVLVSEVVNSFSKGKVSLYV